MAYSRQLVRSTWLAVFAVAILLPPAVVVFIERPRFRNLATELSLMTGLLAVSLLLATLTLPTRVNSILASFGIENVLRIHRLVAMLALLLVVVHIGLVFVGDPRGISIVNLSTAPAPVWAATTSAVALLALIGLGLRRRKRQPRYEGWRMLHIALALLVLGAAGLHVWWVGNLVHRPEMRFIYALLAEAALIVAIRRWIWLPLRSRGRAYKVESVTPISGNAVTVAVRANGHNVLPFHAGQFAWLKIGTSPFAFEEHPFTIASTAEQPDVKEFTIKALGDFSELLSELHPAEPCTWTARMGDSPWRVCAIRISCSSPAVSASRRCSAFCGPSPTEAIANITSCSSAHAASTI
jgi:3-phenylpropionate/trans-cinnamate dioxygenase ferredoxin reductase subunit